jgi:hypothetical protein
MAGRLQPGDFGFHIVAHQMDLVRAAACVRVKRRLRRRHGENQPAIAGIDRGKTQHIAEKGALRKRLALHVSIIVFTQMTPTTLSQRKTSDNMVNCMSAKTIRLPCCS